MKIHSATLRVYQQVHSWVGLLAGFALFIAFYAGALSVFRSDIELWQHPPWQASQPAPLSTQALLERLLRETPPARADFGLMLPRAGSRPYLFWFDQGHFHYLTAEPAATPSEQRPAASLADFIYTLHYSLGASTFGLYLMGLVSLLYGLALISGVIIHLPGLLQQLFALRAGPNLKRQWTDAHNVIGVLSLPFHIIFALTGALFCLLALILPLLGKVAFGPHLASDYAQALAATPVRHQSTARGPQPTLPIQALLRRAGIEAARAGSPEFHPTYLHFVDYGRAEGHVEVNGTREHTTATYAVITLQADDGSLLAANLGPYASLNSSLYSSMLGLHFGNFGGRVVQWLYFILGLAGAFLFYSGNLLWLESRRKRRHVLQPQRVQVMARATLGICLGVCLGISAAFAASWLLRLLGLTSGPVAASSFFAGLLAACLYAGLRPVPAAGYGLCLATAWLSGLTGGLHLLSTLPQLWANRGPAAASVLAVDLIGMTLGLVFFTLGRAARHRARHGDPHSIWATH